jgi:hypothetical protein
MVKILEILTGNLDLIIQDYSVPNWPTSKYEKMKIDLIPSI